jgi:MFS family permease
MLQEIFGGWLVGHPEIGFSALDAGQKAAIATIAAGFVGLLSLFNIAGRFFWASLSDGIGRKMTYFVFFGLGVVLYAAAPSLAHMGLKALFVALSASSCQCTAGASPPFQPIWPIFSERLSSAPSMAGC